MELSFTTHCQLLINPCRMLLIFSGVCTLKQTQQLELSGLLIAAISFYFSRNRAMAREKCLFLLIAFMWGFAVDRFGLYL